MFVFMNESEKNGVLLLLYYKNGSDQAMNVFTDIEMHNIYSDLMNIFS